MGSMQDFLVVLFLFVFLFALVGMQFFANLFRFDANGFVITNINSPEWIYAPDQPRSSFDNFTLAFMTVFQIITIDNWTTPVFNCGRAVGAFGIIHPVLAFLLGTFFITNLFLAMLVNNFLDSEALFKTREEGAIDIDRAESLDGAESLNGPFPDAQVSIPVNDDSESSRTKNNSGAFEATQSFRIRLNKLNEPFSSTLLTICGKILNHDAFEWGITLLVCVSCISLAMDNPLNDPNSVLVSRLYYIDLVITVIFTLEMILKILVFGAFRKRTDSAEAYFRNGINLTIRNLLSYFYSVIFCS